MASSEGQSPEAIAKFVGLSVHEVVLLIRDFNERGLAILDRAALPADPEVIPPPEVPEPTPSAEPVKEPEAVRVSRLERVNAAFFRIKGRVLEITQNLIGMILWMWLALAGIILGKWLAFRRWREPPTPDADMPAMPRTRSVVQPATTPPKPSRFSGIKSEALRFLAYINFMSLFRRIRGRAQGNADQERLELDRPRRTSLLGTGEIRSRVYILRESFYSHRRLQLVVLLLALFFILGGTGTAVYFNRAYKAQKEVQKSVKVMANASSYRSNGVEITIEGIREQRVEEVLDYVAPGEAHSTFKTSINVGGQPDTQTTICRQTLVVVAAQTRYEFCQEEGNEDEQWKAQTVAADFLLGPQAQPWRRLDWIRKVTEETGILAEINGEKTRVFLGSIDKVREANFRFGNIKENPEADPQIVGQWERFVAGAVVSVKAWVREEDGFIARFVMASEFITVDGVTQTKQIDYTFSKFNALEPIAAPDTSVIPIVKDVTDDEEPEPGQGSGQEPGAGGSQQPTTEPGSGSQPGGEPPRDTLFDTSKEAVINGKVFRLEIADNEEGRSQALTGRESLDQNSAMLLVFDAEEFQTYWMKDMIIPIDIVSLDGNRKVVDITSMQPQPQIPDFALRTHKTLFPARYALAMNAGRAAEAGITVGATLELRAASGGAAVPDPTPVPAQPTPVPGQPTTVPAQPTTAPGPGGTQPFLPTVAIINGQSFRLEVADTQEKQAQGLADRDSMDQDSGMLFVFGTEEPRLFWMKGVIFPLDIIFMDTSRTIVEITTMQSQTFVPDYALRQHQSQPARYALEINAGLAEQFGLAVGMVVDFQ